MPSTLDKLPFLIERGSSSQESRVRRYPYPPVFNSGVAGVVATLKQQQQVGNAVREGAVRGVMDFDELHPAHPAPSGALR